MDLPQIEEGSVKSLFRVFRASFDKTVTQCRDAKFLLFDVQLEPHEVKKILPGWIKPSDPPMATFFVVNYTWPAFTVPYREAACMVQVKTLFGRGWHCCWMVLDDDTALIYGREILAYPKKRAEIKFDATDKDITVTVTRRGIEVLTIRAQKGLPEANPGPVLDVKTFNTGGMGQFLAISPIWCFRLTEHILASYHAEAKVTFKLSRHDPIARLIKGESTNARFVVTDITGGRYLFPMGIAGPKWFANTYSMRYR